MPKQPIEITTALLVKQRDGTFLMELVQDDGKTDFIHKFKLTEEAFLQLKADLETQWTLGAVDSSKSD